MENGGVYTGVWGGASGFEGGEGGMYVCVSICVCACSRTHAQEYG